MSAAAAAAPGSSGLGPNNPFAAGGALAGFAPQAYAPQNFGAPPAYLYGLDLPSVQPLQPQQPAAIR